MPPPDEVCYGTVVADTLRLRSDPTTGATVIGGLRAGQRVRILEARLVGENEWARVITSDDVGGWAASWYQGAEFIRYDYTDECLVIQYGDGPQALLVGPHLLFNANGGALAPLLAASSVVKEVSGDGKLLAHARALNPKVVTIYRHTNDCPPDWMDGRQWFNTVAPGWPAGATWYEPQNECGETSRGYSNAFQIELMQAANEAGKCLLLYAFSVGTPSVEFFAQTGPVWDWALKHPCQPGRHHALAWHNYTLGLDWLDRWVFQGWRLRCDALPGYCERVGVWFTEWGAYDAEDQPIDCAREVRNVELAQLEYKNTAIRGVLLWNFGALAPWRDLTPCAGALAGAVG
jgi:hypothetical protein